jgi:hypothetical protein
MRTQSEQWVAQIALQFTDELRIEVNTHEPRTSIPFTADTLQKQFLPQLVGVGAPPTMFVWFIVVSSVLLPRHAATPDILLLPLWISQVSPQCGLAQSCARSALHDGTLPLLDVKCTRLSA